MYAYLCISLSLYIYICIHIERERDVASHPLSMREALGSVPGVSMHDNMCLTALQDPTAYKVII